MPNPLTSLRGAQPALALAPMAGVTDLPFRETARRGGATLTVSEMISSQALTRQGMSSRKQSPFLPDEPGLVVQLMGGDPQVMAEAARINVGMGAQAIDINMGCPVKKVIKTGSGAALMRDEKGAQAVMAAVVKAVPVPVSVKMRLGWDAGSINAVSLARMAEGEGIAALAVHGRTRAQLYGGSADWEGIGAVVAAVSIPVLANGDVKTPQDARDILAVTGAAGVMIGRAALGNPWLFARVAAFLRDGRLLPEPGLEERFKVAWDHLLGLVEHHGAVAGNRLARKHLCWYVRGLPGGAPFRDRINRAATIEETSLLAADYFSTLLERSAA